MIAELDQQAYEKVVQDIASPSKSSNSSMDLNVVSSTSQCSQSVAKIAEICQQKCSNNNYNAPRI